MLYGTQPCCIWIVTRILTFRLLTSVERYDPVTDSWRFVRSMPTARAGACAAELNGHLFVAGGYGDSAVGASAITDIVESYDPSTNRYLRCRYIVIGQR